MLLWWTELTLILLRWRIGWAPNNASRWQMGFNLAFKGLRHAMESKPFAQSGLTFARPCVALAQPIRRSFLGHSIDCRVMFTIYSNYTWLLEAVLKYDNCQFNQNNPPLAAPKSSLQYPQEPAAAASHPAPCVYSSHEPCLFKMYLNVILLAAHWSSKYILQLRCTG